MTLFQRTFTLMIGLVLSACSSLPAPVVDYAPDYDFTNATTFGLYEASGTVSGENPTELTEFQKARLDTALKRALEAKGLTYVESVDDADLLLSWHVNVATKTEVRSYPTPSVGLGVGHGFGRYNRYSLYSCFSCRSDTDVLVRNYDEGTFVVDLIDPQRRQSVWRSVTQSRIKSDNIRDQATLDAAAVRILAEYPAVNTNPADS